MSINTTTPPEVTGHLLLFRKTRWMEDGLAPEAIHAVMERVNAWFDRLTAEGKILGAQPLMDQGVTITGRSGDTITDGPFAETKEAVGGYVLLSVTDFDEAVTIARSNPMLEFGLVTEVRPTASECPHLHRILGRAAEAMAS